MPRRTKSQEIGERGQNVFRTLLDRHWSVNPVENDFGIDFYIERVTDGEVTGETVAIQVKTKDRLDFQRGQATVRLESADLKYWLRHDLPVLVAVIDLSTRNGYFFPVQLLASQAAPSGKTFSIKVNACDRIDREEIFCNAVESSKATIIERTIGQPNEIAKRREMMYKLLDPRFDFNVIMSRHGEHVSLTPCDPEGVAIKVLGHGEGARKLRDVFERGVLREFSPGEIEFSGSPIFDPLSSKRIAFESAVLREIDIAIWFEDSAGNRVGSVSRHSVKATGGQTEIRAGIKLAPGWDVEITAGLHADRVSGEIKFAIHPPPNFSDVRSFRSEDSVLDLLGFSPFLPLAMIAGEWRINGVALPWRVELGNAGAENLYRLRATALCAAVARELDAVIPIGMLAEQDIDAAFIIYAALKAPLTWTDPMGTIDCKLTPTDPQWRTRYGKEAALKLSGSHVVVGFGGRRWRLEELVYEYDRAIIKSAKRVGNGVFGIKFGPAKHARMRMKCSRCIEEASTEAVV
jgi:hypothetical protein